MRWHSARVVAVAVGLAVLTAAAGCGGSDGDSRRAAPARFHYSIALGLNATRLEENRSTFDRLVSSVQ